MYAVIELMMVGMSASVSKSSRYMTSMEVIALPNGARKIAARPPPQPARSRFLRSRSLDLNNVAIIEPNPAPICAIGPSLPALPPVARVTIVAAALIKGTRCLIFPRLL